VLEITDIDRTGDSFMVDVFVVVRNDGGLSRTVFGGAFGIFGAAGVGHGGHHQLRTTQLVDITDAARQLGPNESDLSIRLQGTTLDGEEIAAAKLPIGGMRLVRMQ
jgi:hypothetical protein